MNLALASLTMPIRIRPESPMSDSSLMQFGDENNPFRIEREANGEILIMTPAGGKTGLINSRIGAALSAWAKGDDRGQVFDSSTGFRLPNGAVRSPDASWVSKHRWNALTDEEQDGYPPLCPEFVIELALPSDRVADLKKKLDAEWIANGSELAWLIEPRFRRVTSYRPGRESEVFEDPSSVQGTGCVVGFELVMQTIWEDR